MAARMDVCAFMKGRDQCLKPALDRFLDPCMECGIHCNCDNLNDYPDIIVRTSDNHEIRLCSSVVSGSPELQKLLKSNMNRPVEWEIADRFATWADPSPTYPRRIPDYPEGYLEDFPPKPVEDLRPINVYEATLPITTKHWRLFEKFMSFHLDQVEENVSERNRLHEFTKKAPEQKAGDQCGGSIIFPTKRFMMYAFDPVDEEMFGYLDPAEFLQVVQMKNALQCVDLHYTLERWGILNKGQPPVEEFGWKLRFAYEYAYGAPPTDESDHIQHFLDRAPLKFEDMEDNNKFKDMEFMVMDYANDKDNIFLTEIWKLLLRI